MAQTPTTVTPICSVPRCGRPTDVFVCNGCLEQLHNDLRALAGSRGEPGLAAELLVTMARLDESGPSHAIRERGLEPMRTDQPIAETPLPVNLLASDVLRDVHATLGTWVRRIVGSRYGTDLDGAARDLAYRRAVGDGVHGPWRRQLGPILPADDPTALASWLDLYRQTVAADEAGGELVVDIERITKRADSVIFPRDWEYMGSCWHCDCGSEGCPRCQAEGFPAPAQLYVEQGSVTVACPLPPALCGRSWRVEDRRGWLLEQAKQVPLTAQNASWAVQAYLGRRLAVRRIQEWGQRGRVTRYEPHPGEQELDRLGRPKPPAYRYKVSDLVAVLVGGQVAQGDHQASDSTQPGEPVQRSTC